MANLYLFRIKVQKSGQGVLFGEEMEPSKFLIKVISSKPSAELREGYIWHIGNVVFIEDEGLLFAAGRTTKKSKELYDENEKNFLEVEDEESPFTYVYYDPKFGFLAIEPKSKLSPTVKGIARNVEKLFNRQDVVVNSGYRIEISEIWDPKDFLKHIHQAYAVVSFTVNFGKPNPFDVESDFHKPMEKYLEETGGRRGKATVQGIDLNRDRIEEVARSVASTGNNASAKMRMGEGQRPVTRHLEGDPVTIPIEEEDREDKLSLLQKLREAYSRVRRRREE
ncbi:hypothetical protein AAIA72_01200 [Hahella sp. SMD15-11]|uniref:DUF4747 family protein n=1 Tax=Thermohahella caldifontis TaxID=3142973 RepID=A0AB39UX61_9GAMM